MIIDLVRLAEWIGAISAVGGVMLWFVRVISKYTRQIENLLSWNEKQQYDIDATRENNLYQNKALLAMARSMKDNGFNHTIDDAIKELENAIFRQQAKTFSYQEKDEK